jgi:hypothetical protein
MKWGDCLMGLKQLKRTIEGMIGAVAGIIMGFSIGANRGGNYYADFVFNGLRGYEAVGQIGAVIGGLLGAVCAFLLALIFTRPKENKQE